MPDFHEDSPYNAIRGVRNGQPGPFLSFGGKRWPLCFPFHRWKRTSMGAWGYAECKRCGKRKAWCGTGVMGPVDLHWVLTGEHREMMPPPPTSLVKIGEAPSPK